MVGRKAMLFDAFDSMNSWLQKLILFKGFWWYERKELSNKYEGVLKKLYNFETIDERMIEHSKYGFSLLTSR